MDRQDYGRSGAEKFRQHAIRSHRGARGRKFEAGAAAIRPLRRLRGSRGIDLLTTSPHEESSGSEEESG